MSPRLTSLAAGAALAAAVTLGWSLGRSGDRPAPGTSSAAGTRGARALAPPTARPSSPALAPTPAPGPAGAATPELSAILALVPAELGAGLEAADLEWVRHEAAGYLAARDLSPDQHRQLVRQLAATRQFDVLERQEPMAPQEQP
ncbi:MAG: hypothetical protein IPI49_22980 [Myxococcales bacterium]|nr:hypothetical protein [Myxococcales bacterium]